MLMSASGTLREKSNDLQGYQAMIEAAQSEGVTAPDRAESQKPQSPRRSEASALEPLSVQISAIRVPLGVVQSPYYNIARVLNMVQLGCRGLCCCRCVGELQLQSHSG